MDFVPIEPVEQEIYTRMYIVSGESFGIDDDIYLYAECTLAPERGDSDAEYYYLKILFSVGGEGDRVCIMGMSFGEESYTQQQIDEVMDRVVEGQVNSNFFFQHLRTEVEREDLWQEELLRRRRSKFHFDSENNK